MESFKDSYVDFLIASFNCEVSAMNAENKQREVQGDSMAYTEEAYATVAEKYTDMFDKYIEKNLKKRK